MYLQLFINVIMSFGRDILVLLSRVVLRGPAARTPSALATDGGLLRRRRGRGHSGWKRFLAGLTILKNAANLIPV